ncbi:MAG: DUF3786 domain-containing protein [Firmicutes bacterium]|nr:DUF3786 domain-containing protein [Bacillota bacterium]
MKPQGGRGKYNIEVALEKAIHNLAAKNPREVSVNSGINFNRESKEYLVPFLGSRFFVHHETGKVTSAASKEEAPLHTRLLILHYLYTANGRPLAGEWITFKELPGGQIYVKPYTNRAIRPLEKAFGSRPDRLLTAAAKLGGKEGNFGDFCAVLQVLPRVPMAFVLWEGDEEFPPRGNILYDANASCYLPTEDYALLPGIVIGELLKQL